MTSSPAAVAVTGPSETPGDWNGLTVPLTWPGGVSHHRCQTGSQRRLRARLGQSRQTRRDPNGGAIDRLPLSWDGHGGCSIVAGPVPVGGRRQVAGHTGKSR